MLAERKITVIFILFILIFTFFSGCVIQDFLFGTSFEIKSWDVINDEGFPALSYTYSCSDYVKIKTYSPESGQVDTDFFFRGEDSNRINIENYKKSIKNGVYKLKAFDLNDEEVYSKKFSFTGPSLSILSCEQHWWLNNGETILLGLSFEVYNDGDVPGYPYSLDINLDDDFFSEKVLPVVVNPGESNTIHCVICKKGEPEAESFDVYLKDIDGEILSTGNYFFDVENSVTTKFFDRGLNKKMLVPYPDFLFDYYTNQERATVNDYSIYVFDPYDDTYIDLFIDRLIDTLSFKQAQFNSKTDVEKINFIAKFVQYLEYKEDIPSGSSDEYANYPIETLFNRDIGCDCEDKSILAACLIDRLGYNVSLFRLPNHMAVGINLSEGDVSKYDFYEDGYYFLETTTENAPVGFIPNDYQKKENLEIYEIKDRALLTHFWKDNVFTIYTDTKKDDFVKVETYVKNHGRAPAYDVEIEGIFQTKYGIDLNSVSKIIDTISPGVTKKIVFSVGMPGGVETIFKTRVYLDNELVDYKESKSSFS